MRVDFWFHPGCPWTWVTSRWLVEVAPHRDLDIHWRSFSLTLLNGCADVPRKWRARAEGAHDVLRVVEAARAGGQPERSIGDFYTGAARELFGGEWPLHVPRTLSAAGLDPALAAHADDDSHDTALREEVEIALSRTGPDVGTPILTFAPGQGEREGSLFGPVISKAPRGAEAVKLWQAVETLATSGVAEMKRSLRAKPDFS
jgi:2-hydroxychromene-2-carboxylate isomerase